MAGIVEAVRADLEILLGADVDGVMFCNEGDGRTRCRPGRRAWRCWRES